MKIRPILLASLLAVLPGGCGHNKLAVETSASHPVLSYDAEVDWTDSQKVIALGYQEAQGKRVFYQYCVWCHADATPAGPSNRSNLTPTPALLNDGAELNAQSDEYLQNMITLGGSAMGKSAMMPPFGKTIPANDIKAVIAFTRAIAQPPHQPSAQPQSQYSPK